MEYKIRIVKIEKITHDVKRFTLEKPEAYAFVPGQATDVSVDKPGWEDNKHPFTFTSINSEPFLQFVIKGYPVSKYPNHEGVTELIHKLDLGDSLIVEEPFGTINYKGKGVFIAGGAGITPFIAIFRDLHKRGELVGNKFIFSNKERRDIILEKWLREIFPPNDLILTLTREKREGYENGRVDEKFLKKHLENFKENFYICGPGKMVKDLREVLKKLGADVDSVVFEK